MPLRHLDAVRALAAAQDDGVRHRRHPADDARAVDGHALVAGQHHRLQGRAARGRRAEPLLPDADDRRGDGAARRRCFVIGAGVAGLQAIATARRLGASVVATDVRPEVKEQIESVGAKYVGIELSAERVGRRRLRRRAVGEDRAARRNCSPRNAPRSDVVITTALIGGVFAPRLISADTVRSMKPGSVIVDLGADGGGNCELSKPGETVQADGVTIIAPLNVPATMPNHASLLFSRNLTAFLLAFTKDKAFQLDLTTTSSRAPSSRFDGRGEARAHPRGACRRRLA